jgi:hypothetical protein
LGLKLADGAVALAEVGRQADVCRRAPGDKSGAGRTVQKSSNGLFQTPA